MKLQTSLLCLGLPLWVACTPSAPVAEPVRSVKLVQVNTADAAAPITFAGEVRAQQEARLSFRIGGLLMQRQVKLGQSFRAGQVLAELDPKDIGLSSQAAQAQIEAARVQKDLASAELKRYEELLNKGFIGPAEWDRRRATYLSSVAQFNQAMAQGEVAANQARYAQLVAQRDGVVVGIEAEPGQVLSAGTPVLRVAWEGPREIQAWVPEDQWAAWHIGQTVEVSRWADEQRLPARVREIAASADPVTRSYLIRIDLPSGAKWVLGQTARVHVQQPLPQASGPEVILPTSAVLEFQGQPSVWVYDPAQRQVQPKAVQVRGYLADQVRLAPTLSQGTWVVSAGAHLLSPGLTVNAYQGKNPSPLAQDGPMAAGGRP